MRTQTILRDKKGLSLIFVLAAMLLLLALGVSVLTAAGLSNRAVHAKDAANQRALYMESMSRVMYAVLDAEGPESLTEYLIKSIYDEFYDEFDPDDPTTWIPRPSRTIEIEVDDAILTGGLANDARFEITIFINTAAKFTLPLFLDVLMNAMPGLGYQYHFSMAAGVVGTVPLVLVFVIMQKYFIESIVATGIKG